MKNSKWCFTLFLALAFFTACNKDDDDILLQEEDYLIFGHFYGFCQGETCIEIFRLDESTLMEDTNDNYPQTDDFYEGDFTLLSDEKFQIVAGLESQFPLALLDEAETVIGQPDAADGGGLYIEYSKDGVRDFWLIDLVTENIPEAYREFVDTALEKIQQINE